MIPMSREQRRRSNALYLQAVHALSALSEERLNLSHETREALNRTRGALEEFDVLWIEQPLIDEAFK